MAIRPRSGIVAMVKHVRAFFVDRRIHAAVALLAPQERFRSHNQSDSGANRIVFALPEKGRLGAARDPGPRDVVVPGVEPGTTEVVGSVRSLMNEETVIRAFAWASDRTTTDDPENSEAHIEATELLFERLVQAIHDFGHQDIAWGEVGWTKGPERAFGLEKFVDLTCKFPIFDDAYDVVKPSPAVSRGAPPEET